MSKNHVYIPPNVARLMSPEDRRRYGLLTPEQQKGKIDLTLEREVHDQISSFLYRNNFRKFYHSDPVRRPTIAVGLPDFGIFRASRILFGEVKIKPNKLSPDQEIAFMEMGNDGNIVLLWYSFQEARESIIKFFNLENTQ